uniref:Transcription initiation factor TFIID subunit 12 n=1 Tax=Syphacia muris TaxID=451379 RepID=A0A0N5AZR5_9BILA
MPTLSAGRPVVQLRVEGNRILSSSELRQQPESKVAIITTNGIPLSRASVTPVQQVIFQNNVTYTGALLEKARLDDLMKQIDPSTIIEDPAKDALLEFMDDFVEEVIERTCQVSHHRGAEMIETKDVEYVLEKYFKIPRFPKGNGIAELLRGEGDVGFSEKLSRSAHFAAHNQRLSVINKTIKKI